MQQLSKIKDWWMTALGLVFLLAAIVVSLSIMYQSTGLGHQPSLSTTDKNVVTNAQSVTPESSVQVISKPTRLIATSIDVGINILDSTINIQTNEWPLSDDKVHYANFTSGLGNTRGTLLLYGHNSWPVLRKTADLQIGDTIILVDENDKQWTFKYYEEKVITPDQVDFIYEDVPFRVVIFTCNGWADQYRRLMFFQPV